MQERKGQINYRTRTQYLTDKNNDNPRNVRFSDAIMQSTPSSKKRHHSSSILKNKKSFHNFGSKKVRSDSVNSLAGQGPKDDQSCQNSLLNKMFKDQYVKILQKFSTKGNYVDQIFPPVISSLFSYAGRKKFKQPNIKWKRIPDVFPQKDLIMWGVDPTKNFISGSSHLANEYFSIALNCMKGNKTLLRKMFESQKPNPQGIYYVKIFQANVWKYTIIDDHIPVFEQKKGENITYRPVFVKGNIDLDDENDPIEIWPYLLQKAFAKYYSSYQSLQTGNVFDFLQELTNNTVQYINIQKSKIDLRQMFKQQVDLIAFGEDEQQKYYPIFFGTALSDKIWFENPQNPQIRKNIYPQQLEKYFKILYLIKSNIYTYFGFCPIRQTKQSISVRYFNIQNPTKCSITLNQKDHKFFQESFKYTYKWIRMMILLKQINDNGYRWIDGRYDNQKSMTIQFDFQAGQYYIIVLPEWQQRAYDLNLILRTKTPLRLERKIYDEGLIQQGCADLAQRYGRLNQLNTYICSYNCIHEDMGMIIQNINNERMKGQVRVLRSIDGLKADLPLEPINKQFKKNKSIQVIIKNNSHFTVVLMMKGGIDRNFFQNFDFGSK